jgi:hypothetical protein
MGSKRWLSLGLLALGIVAAVLIVLALLPPRPGVTKENFDRIEIGMTEAEVEAIFGEAASIVGGKVWSEYENELVGAATIAWDNNGRVEEVWWRGRHDNRTIWQKVLDRLTWREREKETIQIVD